LVSRAVIIGASSGIGRAIAKILASNGYSIGLVARRGSLLYELGAELPTPIFVKAMDVSKPFEALPFLREVIAEMGGVELFVVSAGTGIINRELDCRALCVACSLR
jgi:short-subunit dehydrogenase